MSGGDQSTNVVRYPKLKVLVLLYPLYEEMEFDIAVGCIRRGGIPVTIAGKDMKPVIGSRGIKKLPEMTLKQAMTKGPWDCIVLIGGKDAWRALSDDNDVGEILRQQEKGGRLIAAICTSPIAMKKHGIMYGRKLTSYPTVENVVKEGNKYIYKYDDVVEDRNLITSRGNITSFNWSLRVVQKLTDIANARDAGTEMIVVY